MHDDEVPIDEPLVRSLLRRQFPHLAGRDLSRVRSHGTDNALYRIGDGLVARLPRIHWAVDAVIREYTWLPRLAPHLPGEIPEPVALGQPGDGYPHPWAIYRWLDGHNPDADEAATLVNDLSQVLRALRLIAVHDDTPRSNRGGPLRRRDDATRTALAELGDPADLVDMWDDALTVPDWPHAPVWLHADLAPGNLLVRDGRLAAVIDFGLAGTGDPAVDLIPAWTVFDRRGRDAFREAMQPDHDTWRRARGWALSIAVIQLPYYQHRNPPLAQAARGVLHELTT